MTTLVNNDVINVLLVEDNAGDARLVSEMLNDSFPEGFHVIRAEFLTEAIEHIGENSIDVILLDLSLPDGTGLETVKRMRTAALKLPIVILTGHSDETLALQAMREGAQDYLLKHNLNSHLLKRVLCYAIERKRADQLQREGEERFRALVQHSTDIITVVAADGAVLYQSPSFEKVMGFRPAWVEGMTLTSLVHLDDRMRFSEAMTTLLNEPTATFSTEIRLLHADESWRTLETTMTNLLNYPEVRGIVINSRDVTARRQTEAQVEKQGNLLDQVSDAIITLDINGIIQFWNRGSERLYGWSADEVTGKLLAEVIQTEVVNDTMDNAVHTVLDTGAWNGEYLQICKDGTRLPVLNATTLLRDGQGAPVGYIGINRDITERKRAEEAQQQLHHQLEQQNLEIAAIYNATSFLFKSDSLLNLGHQMVQAVIGEFQQAECGLMLKNTDSGSVTQLAHSAAYPVPKTSTHLTDDYGLIADALHTGQIIYVPDVTDNPGVAMSNFRTRSELVIPLKTANGTLAVLDLHSLAPDAFSPRDQRVLNAFAERAAAAIQVMQLYEELNRYAGELEWRVVMRTAELQRAKEQVEAVLNHSSDAIVLVRTDNTLIQANPAFCYLLNYTIDEVLGKATREFVDAPSADLLVEALSRTVKTNTPSRIEVVLRCKDGTMLEGDMALAPILQSDAPELSVICSIRDNTARKQAEHDLRTALAKERQLNELKSRFVSMVSHDFRSPLATIQLSSDLLRNYGNRMTDEKQQQHFTTINTQINHLSGLLEDTLTISKSEAVGLSLSTVPTNFVIFCETIAMEMQSIAGTREIRFAASDELGLVEIDRNLMRRAIVNLLTNAVKYSPEQSVIDYVLYAENEHVVIVIRDQGIGIPDADKTHLFEVFHRAANVSDIPGTGLGLAIVKRAVDAHKGSIAVESQVGTGTTFTISLPVIQSLPFKPS